MSELSQYGKPSGSAGNEIIASMNEHHRELSEWALSMIEDDKPASILDIGCGGGMQISLMADMFPDAEITGLDHSPDAVLSASKLNSDLIAAGKCGIIEGSVKELPFGDGRFDLVTAFETYFFWPDLENSIAEACRTVAPGGKIMIVSETYPSLRFGLRNRKNKKLYGMNIVSNRRMRAMLETEGMSVMTETRKQDNWVCFIGRKGPVSS
ncbi:MAG: class I SAM-dependent methyltransferase [Thermoplasmatales archaeon]|jgi:ubiquinone/menaquinone biosynthesis C-methylase UbiE|nr:class I SAM-dependent methyltransferase [Thermoplasmatales archaeon]